MLPSLHKSDINMKLLAALRTSIRARHNHLPQREWISLFSWPIRSLPDPTVTDSSICIMQGAHDDSGVHDYPDTLPFWTAGVALISRSCLSFMIFVNTQDEWETEQRPFPRIARSLNIIFPSHSPDEGSRKSNGRAS